MSKDKIIEVIERIQDHCRSMRCEECQFFTDAGRKWECDITEFIKLFKNCPNMWDIEKIKELL